MGVGLHRDHFPYKLHMVSSGSDVGGWDNVLYISSPTAFKYSLVSGLEISRILEFSRGPGNFQDLKISRPPGKFQGLLKVQDPGNFQIPDLILV